MKYTTAPNRPRRNKYLVYGAVNNKEKSKTKMLMKHFVDEAQCVCETTVGSRSKAKQRGNVANRTKGLGR